MNGSPDQELVERAQRGETAPIGELFSRYWRAARAAAFGVTGEFASAEDAASEAFRQAMAGIGTLRDPARFGAWLRTIVVREARVRVEKFWQGTNDDLAAALRDPNETAQAALERQESAALLREAVRALPEPLREAIALFYFEGYDTDAAAKFLDVPPGTLRRRLHDARARLRDSVEQIFKGRNDLSEQQERLMEKVKALIANGEIYQAVRESLALRPLPKELADAVFPPLPLRPVQVESARELARQILRPSERASDPNHSVGAMAAAIRKALPVFREWKLDPAELALPSRRVLPPGFSEGVPGAFVRATRALVRVDDGSTQSIFEHLQASPDPRTFAAAKGSMRVSDVLDLTWMSPGSLELRAVQDLLEDLASLVLPTAQVRFSSYDEPRYRAALQLQFDGLSARAAVGGVLLAWAGHPANVAAAHVRLFLEPWAAAQTGESVEYERLPEMQSGANE